VSRERRAHRRSFAAVVEPDPHGFGGPSSGEANRRAASTAAACSIACACAVSGRLEEGAPVDDRYRTVHPEPHPLDDCREMPGID
jgi:hypothetical protein